MPTHTPRYLLPGIVTIALVACCSIALSLRALRRAEHASAWVNHTHAIVFESSSLVSSLRAGDAALKAYAAGGDPGEAGAARIAFAEVAEQFEVLRALQAATGERAPALEAATGVLQNHLASARRLLAAPDNDPGSAHTRLSGVVTMAVTSQDISRHIGKLTEFHKARLQEHDREAYRSSLAVRWAVSTGAIVTLVLLAALYGLLRGYLAERVRVQETLERANRELDARVAERTRELAAANQNLQIENLERQWACEAVQHQLRYSQLVINALGDPVCMITRDRNIVRANPAACRWTGYSEKGLIGAPLHRILRVERPTGGADTLPRDPVQDALRAGRDLVNEPGIVMAEDGSQRRVIYSLFPVRDADKVVGAVVTMHQV